VYAHAEKSVVHRIGPEKRAKKKTKKRKKKKKNNQNHERAPVPTCSVLSAS